MDKVYKDVDLDNLLLFPESVLEHLPFEVRMDNQFENVLSGTPLQLEFSTGALDHSGLAEESSTKNLDLKTLDIVTTSSLDREIQALSSAVSSGDPDAEIQALRPVPPRSVLNIFAELNGPAESERSISRGNPFEDLPEVIEKVEGQIRDQIGAQNGPEQIEIRKGNLIQITLDDKYKGWIGAMIINASPIFRQDTIVTPEGLCPFSLKGPGKVLSLGKNEVVGTGPAFVQAVELVNQDHLEITFDVYSSNPCNNGNKRAARAMWKLHVFPVGSDPEKNLHQLELQHLLERGCAMNIQVMAEMRKKDRKLKRNRNDFPATTFSFEETENDALKKRAKKQYSEFLETLDSDSLKNEVETPCFGKKIEDITVNSLTGKEN